ncbi:MAG: class I SAM-dependent methyltransferase [Bacteroidota bacterium]
MSELATVHTPSIYSNIEKQTKKVGFNMSSDRYVGSLLKTLVASKPKGNFLEIGTGTGLALAWIVDGMDAGSKVVSIDNDRSLTNIAAEAFTENSQVQLVCADGEQWIKQYKGEKLDLIFADSWPGKYCVIEQTLELLKVGAFYIIDDMLSQPGWPDGHQEKAQALMEYLEDRADLHLTKMSWSTGIVIATKI